MIRNRIRQMLRTPVKLAAFLSLITASSFLLTLGLNLFFISRETQKEAQNSFITIGTVEQKASNSGREALWDVTDKDYIYVSRKIYDAPISDSVLDIEGMPYIHKPKHQPVYGSIMKTILSATLWAKWTMHGSEMRDNWQSSKSPHMKTAFQANL